MHRHQLKAWAQLLRLPGLFTAWTNSVASYLIATRFLPMEFHTPHTEIVLKLAASSTLLYAGGLVMNDIADFHHDIRHNPRRPLPSSIIQRSTAVYCMLAFFIIALGCLATLGIQPLITGGGVLLLIASYNYATKHVPVLGSLNMALCRVANALLGLSVYYSQLDFPPVWQILAQPALLGCYVLFVTLASQMEDKAGNKSVFALESLLCFSLFALPAVVLEEKPEALVVGALAVLLIGLKLQAALKHFTHKTVRPVIGTMVMVIPLLDAAVLAGFGLFEPALAASLSTVCAICVSASFDAS